MEYCPPHLLILNTLCFCIAMSVAQQPAAPLYTTPTIMETPVSCHKSSKHRESLQVLAYSKWLIDSLRLSATFHLVCSFKYFSSPFPVLYRICWRLAFYILTLLRLNTHTCFSFQNSSYSNNWAYGCYFSTFKCLTIT